MTSSAVLLGASILMFAASAFGESAFERELKDLSQQRDKAAAAALEPVNRKYADALQQMLRRATQANDLDAAVKIKATLATLSGASAPTVTNDSSTGKMTETDAKRLVTGVWHFSGNGWTSQFKFDPAGSWTSPGGNATGTWKMGADKISVIFADGRENQLLLPLRLNGSKGLDFKNQPFTAVQKQD